MFSSSFDVFFSDGLRESHVTTKYFDVNDNYSENYSEPLEEYSEIDQTIEILEPVPFFFDFPAVLS